MKILKGKVDWLEGRTNRPKLYLLVDTIPSLHTLRFTCRESIYFAERDGYCRFFAHRGEGSNGGFGGDKFDIRMIDGTIKTLHGPWSSNSGEVNKHGFGPCTEAYLTTDSAAFERGRPCNVGDVLLTTLREAADRIDVSTGYTWRPGAPYASEVTFPRGSRFALACYGQVRVDRRDSTDYKLVVRPEVFPDALLAALAVDNHSYRSPWSNATPALPIGHDLAHEIGERYRRHVPYEPIDTLLSLSSYEAAVQFPDGEYWVKPATT
jgi:hypothetical protein